MSKMPNRDEDCCVDILALVHGGPTTTNEIVRHVDRAAGLYACDIAIRRTAKALNRVVHQGNSQSIQVWQNRGSGELDRSRPPLRTPHQRPAAQFANLVGFRECATNDR
jgi:hypothetical protein